METSQELNELAAALAKAQGELRAAEKVATNPHFRSRYAPLSELRAAIREPFAKHGLSVTQPLSNSPDGVRITCMLMHSSGQWIRDVFDVPAQTIAAQALGSATTYALKYSLQAITGLAPDDPDDDDGHAATESAPQSAPRKTLREEFRKRVEEAFSTFDHERLAKHAVRRTANCRGTGEP